jgi:hypothetical protein
MSNWQPIETAPTGQKVRLGKWYFAFDGKPIWMTSAAIAYEATFFGLSKRATFYGDEYTHWMPLPSPPEAP